MNLFSNMDLMVWTYEFPDASDKANFALWVRDISNEFQPYGLEVHFIIHFPFLKLLNSFFNRLLLR